MKFTTMSFVITLHLRNLKVSSCYSYVRCRLNLSFISVTFVISLFNCININRPF